MKFSPLVGLLFSFQVFSAEQFIVKTNKDFNKINVLKNFGQIKTLNLSFGTYQVLTSNQKLNSFNVKSIESLKGVDYIEHDQLLKTQEIEINQSLPTNKDWYYDQQWGLLNTGANSSGGNSRRGVAGEDINAESAWEISGGSNDVVIAVIDTGVDHQHPDLMENMWINMAEQNGQPGVDDDGNGFIDDIHGYDFVDQDGDPMDEKGHGTHCAGIIGAGHNEVGIKGTMKKVKIMAVRFLDKAGTGTVSDAIQAIDYAVRNKAQILSNSWAGNFYSQALFDGVEASTKAGLPFTAAAGNEQNDNDQWETYPADFALDNVISVGAMTGAGGKASFSNYGKNSVDVFAPGESILATYIPKSYKWLSGTSMATPFVSGILGLALAKNSNLTVRELKDSLVESSVKNDELKEYAIGGRADAFNFLKSVLNL